MNKFAVGLALVAIGFSSLALWWTEDLGKRFSVQTKKSDDVAEQQSKMRQHMAKIQDHFSNRLGGLESALGILSDEPKTTMNKVDMQKTLARFKRSDDNNRQEIDFLKSQRLLHEKEIANLKNELQLLKRDYGRLARSIDR